MERKELTSFHLLPFRNWRRPFCFRAAWRWLVRAAIRTCRFLRWWASALPAFRSWTIRTPFSMTCSLWRKIIRCGCRTRRRPAIKQLRNKTRIQWKWHGNPGQGLCSFAFVLLLTHHHKCPRSLYCQACCIRHIINCTPVIACTVDSIPFSAAVYSQYTNHIIQTEFKRNGFVEDILVLLRSESDLDISRINGDLLYMINIQFFWRNLIDSQYISTNQSFEWHITPNSNAILVCSRPGWKMTSWIVYNTGQLFGQFEWFE